MSPLDVLHRLFFRTLSLGSVAGQNKALEGYFNWWHRQSDPWKHAVDPDEIAKFRVTVAALSTRRYERILDVGCSEGVLTRMVSVEHPTAAILGVDISERAIKRAMRSANANLQFKRLDILTGRPGGHFDLVLCSESLYYFGGGALLRLASERLSRLLEPEAHLVLVHPWPECYRLYRWLDADPQLRRIHEHVESAVRRPFAVTRYERVGLPG